MNDITAYNSIMLGGDFQNFGYDGSYQGFPFVPITYTVSAPALAFRALVVFFS